MLNLYILVFNNNYLLKTKSRFILISKEIPGIKKRTEATRAQFFLAITAVVALIVITKVSLDVFID